MDITITKTAVTAKKIKPKGSLVQTLGDSYTLKAVTNFNTHATRDGIRFESGVEVSNCSLQDWRDMCTWCINQLPANTCTTDFTKDIFWFTKEKYRTFFMLAWS